MVVEPDIIMIEKESINFAKVTVPYHPKMTFGPFLPQEEQLPDTRSQFQTNVL